MANKRSRRSITPDFIFWPSMMTFMVAPMTFAIALALGAAVSAVAPVLLPIIAIALAGIIFSACRIISRGRSLRRILKEEQHALFQSQEEAKHRQSDLAEQQTGLNCRIELAHREADKIIAAYHAIDSQTQENVDSKPLIPNDNAPTNSGPDTTSTKIMLTGLDAPRIVISSDNAATLQVFPDSDSINEASSRIEAGISSLFEKQKTIAGLRANFENKIGWH